MPFWSGTLPKLLLLLASLAAVLALAAIAWWLGLGRSEPLDEEEVRERIAFEYAPASARELFLSEDGKTALARCSDGRWVGIKAHGSHPASRVLPLPLQLSGHSDGVEIATGDRWFGPLLLRLSDAEQDRLRRLL